MLKVRFLDNYLVLLFPIFEEAMLFFLAVPHIALQTFRALVSTYLALLDIDQQFHLGQVKLGQEVGNYLLPCFL
jgi:hypothetical protein